MRIPTETASRVLSLPRSSRIAERAGWISLFALLTGLAALVEIPLGFTPVPVTLQTLVVIGSGVILGRDGWISQFIYLLLGGVGLPFFAGGTGHFQYVFGATGGYLIGFVAVSAIAGRWIHPVWAKLNFSGRAWRLFLASLVVFIPGVLQLKLAGNLTMIDAMWLGFLPFVPVELAKALMAAGIPARSLRK